MTVADTIIRSSLMVLISCITAINIIVSHEISLLHHLIPSKFEQFRSILPKYFQASLDSCVSGGAVAYLINWCTLHDPNEMPLFLSLTLNVWGPSYLGLTRSVSWLLMPWLLTSPGHQQPWYWPCRICESWPYLRKDFKYPCHINVE